MTCVPRTRTKSSPRLPVFDQTQLGKVRESNTKNHIYYFFSLPPISRVSFHFLLFNYGFFIVFFFFFSKCQEQHVEPFGPRNEESFDNLFDINFVTNIFMATLFGTVLKINEGLHLNIIYNNVVGWVFFYFSTFSFIIWYVDFFNNANWIYREQRYY